MLTKKYRPKLFKQVIGQDSAVKILTKELKKGKNRKQVFLFHGPYGCGKSTLALIYAAKLGAKNPPDLIKLNISHTGGKDQARQIADSALYAPLSGKHKVFLLEEVQKATIDFQNALLDILEFTPQHCTFIFCTTDPQKLIAPLKSRCSQIKIQIPERKEISELLKKIISEEAPKSIYFDYIDDIIDITKGHIRDCLELLEQIFALSKEKEIEKFLDNFSVEDKDILALCQALLKLKTWKEVSELVKRFEDKEAEAVRHAIKGYMAKVVLNEKTNNLRAFNILECFLDNFYESGFAGLIYACRSAMLK